MVTNLGLVEGEISNERKFKRNGEPMEHGVRKGHRWAKTEAYCNGKYIDFAGVSKSMAKEQAAAAKKK
jgi:centrosomal protein CEP164